MDITDHLPGRTLSYHEVYELMGPSHDGIGLATAVSVTADRQIIALQIEHDGIMKGVYHTDEGWKQTDTTIENVDEVIHDETVQENFVKGISEKATDETDLVMSQHPLPKMSRIDEQPIPGWHSKMCIRHRPLNSTDYGELSEWPQILEASPLWGAMEEGIVGVATFEPDPSEELNIVYLFYRPDLGTWRILDTLDDGASTDQHETLHYEVKDKLSQYYDELKELNPPAKS